MRRAGKRDVIAEGWYSPANLASRDVNNVTAVNGVAHAGRVQFGFCSVFIARRGAGSVADGNGDSSRGGWWSARKFIASSGPRASITVESCSM